MTVCLIALRRNRFEIYSEPPEEPLMAAARGGDGRLRRWAHAAALQWHELVEAARHGRSSGRLARWRDAVVRRLSETIAEQRTLWALRKHHRATLLFPSTLAPDLARRYLDGVLSRARWHHGLWLSLDAVILTVSAILAPIPGPNVIAYYLGFRVVGHYWAWRGARHALAKVEWTLQPDANLAELASLVDLPCAARASQVSDIAARLNLHRLRDYFDRVAV
jgi:hypothetical protein